jgi:hypothetical protein
MKHCSKCNTTKPLTAFFKDKNKSQGVGSTCKQCLQSVRQNEEWRARRRKNRPKVTTEKECQWCNNIFKVPNERGQRDRKFCCECEQLHKNIFGDKISAIVGSSVSTARMRAKEQNLPFDITTDYIYNITPKNGICPILKMPMCINTRYTLSIDKIIPEKGYVTGNVQIISIKANQMKNDATIAELLLFANYIQRNIPNDTSN